MNLERKRVFIVVKTYPTISEKYSELVCTAGILEDGSWIRLYPIPFRKLFEENKYQKYSWIHVDVVRNNSDFRPESYRPLNLDNIHVEPKPKTADWDERKRIILKNQKVYTNMKELISCAKNDGKSLALFKPTSISDFIIESTSREWNPKKLESLRCLSQQLNFFQTPEEIEDEFKVVQKVPYKFSYRFTDDSGATFCLMIEDWEIGMLYFHCLKQSGHDEKEAVRKVRQKYIEDFTKKDIHLFLGTTKQFHNIAPNPFIIIGVFYPPFPSPVKQISLFDL